MIGKGLAKGMGITLRTIFKKKITQMYPEVKPTLPPRTRSSMALEVPKCIACGLCVNACPNNVITLKSVKDENNKKVLSEYVMNTGRCLFCGLCTEACPTKALKTTTEFENAVYNKPDLTWDMIQKYKDKAASGEEVESKQGEGKDNG